HDSTSVPRDAGIAGFHLRPQNGREGPIPPPSPRSLGSGDSTSVPEAAAYDPRPMRRGLAYFLFLLSGATALCYEVAWTRHLVLVFGSTTRAVALILAAYMLGLALGSEAGG